MFVVRNILKAAQKASSSTSVASHHVQQPAPVPNVAASHHVQQPAPVVPPNVAAGPSSFGSTAQLQSHNLPLHQVDLMPSSLSVGQDETFEKVRIFLNDDNNGIIGIYGMGGVGKTTLMKRVHNDLLVKCNFGKIIWIVVSKEVDERKIQRDILAKLGLPASQDETQDEQAFKIYNKLRMMKFVLLLDDIWKPLDMEYLGIPTPTQVNKYKIIFTTRSKEVSAEMHPHKEVEVVGLGWENAWILFQQNVGDKALNSNPSIRGLAEKVAKECGGLPLALKVIGQAMASKNTPQQWENALSTLRKSPSEISGTEAKLFARLKLSYDALPSPTKSEIKECFLYCCLFPEDFSIDKEKLVEYWVGEGFFKSDENLIEARNRGLDYIDTLMASFLLEEVNQDKVKMHDVIRDMGIWIAREHGKKKHPDFFVHPSVRLSKSRTADRWMEAERVFVSKSKELPQMTSQCHISTILFGEDYQNNAKCIESLDGLFNSTPLLRVLDLDVFNHEALPAAMEKLVELRFLRVGRKSYISKLPSLTSVPSWLGNLAKLETLILINTEIRVLPNTIGQLVELRHLNLENCKNLKALPVELGDCCKLEMLNLENCSSLEMLPTTVGKLSDLRYLDLSWTRIKTLPEEFWELNNLEDLYFYGNKTMRFTAIELSKLEDMQYLNHVEICVKGLPNLSRLSNCLTRLWVDYCRPSTVEICEDELSMDFLQVFGNADRLSELRIEESPVEKIKASNINTTFSGLRELEIWRCGMLKHIFGLHHLPRLQSLSIRSCKTLEEVIISENSSGGGGNICFPTLRYVRIDRLHGLKSICSDSVSFPSLEKFILRDCPRLEKLPLGLMNGGSSTLRDLTIRRCEKLEEVIISENSSGGGGNICFPMLTHLRIDGLHALKSICSDSVSFPSLETFFLGNCPRLEKLPPGLMNGGNNTLGDLTITGCQKLEEVIISENSSGGGGNICFPTLTYMYINRLHGLKSICSDSVSFPSLEYFRLSDCPRLEKLPLGLMNGGNSTLRDLTITGCEKLEDVIISENSSGGGGNICFPTLKYLSISSLHGLKSICSDTVSFPSLMMIRLSDCPRLEKLPLGLMNGGNSTLRGSSEISGPEEWWDGLKWQDGNFKSFLQPFFDLPH